MGKTNGVENDLPRLCGLSVLSVLTVLPAFDSASGSTAAREKGAAE